MPAAQGVAIDLFTITFCVLWFVSLGLVLIAELAPYLDAEGERDLLEIGWALAFVGGLGCFLIGDF